MRPILFAAAALLLSSAAAQAAPDSFRDPLDVPAAVTRLGASTQLAAVTQAGNRLVAVGVRGLIIVSDDDGATWTQRPAPVSSDLLAVQFPTATDGWAVGQDGVVLHSADGGTTWRKQLDGRDAAAMLREHFRKLADAGNPEGKRLLQEIELNYAGGPEQALLDVWFDDAKNGFVCGSFGTLLETHDGGKTWQSSIERVDYRSMLHFNAMRGIGGHIYIASERGIVFQLDRDTGRFVPQQTGYDGSFMSLAGEGNTVVAAGLQGTVYRSDDAGKSWRQLQTGLLSSITAATSAEDGMLFIASQSGDLLFSNDNGSHFQTAHVSRPTLLTGVVQVDPGKAVAVGLTGVQQIQFK